MKLSLAAIFLLVIHGWLQVEATPAPSFKPSKAPTTDPTIIPTRAPTARPSGPSIAPSRKPSSMPTAKPTNPSAAPTFKPTNTVKPTGPSIAPTSVAPSLAPTHTPTASIGDTIVEFPYTGDVQTFTVPAGVTELTVTLVGASGGTALYSSTLSARGGRGAMITALVPVNTNDVFHIYVGGAANLKVGGYNGGGDATGGSTIHTAGGGGATDLRTYPFGIDDRMLVAGGGGGGGGNCPSEGGDAGYPNGFASAPCSSTIPSEGGTQHSGGAADVYESSEYYVTGKNVGAFFYGGEAVYSPNGGSRAFGGAGGGGYYGGGGGFATGGGGGSSYSNYPVFMATNGTWYGNGTAWIAYTLGAQDPTTTPTAAPSANPTLSPTASPTANPSAPPTAVPTTATPTAAPSAVPTTASPTVAPTLAPTNNDPTASPTHSPTAVPTTAAPTADPTASPTATPTTAPSMDPTAAPTAQPSATPTAAPSAVPTTDPSAAPSTAPSAAPTVTATMAPTSDPSAMPTAAPSAIPTVAPTEVPTFTPTPAPSAAPTAKPTSFVFRHVELVVDVRQDVYFMTKANYDAQKAIYNLTIQHTVAAAMSGVTPDRVTDITVEETAPVVVTPTAVAHPHATVAEAVSLGYRVTVYDPELTVDQLRTDVMQAAAQGKMDQDLNMYAAQFGAFNIENATFAEPRVFNALPQRSSSSRLTGPEIAVLVVGVVLFLVLLTTLVFFILRRGGDARSESTGALEDKTFQVAGAIVVEEGSVNHASAQAV